MAFFVGRWLPFPTVRNHLQKLWKWKEPLSVSFDLNLLYLKIGNEDDNRKILEAGPVLFNGRIFIFETWSPQVGNQRERINMVPICVKVCDLPKEL